MNKIEKKKLKERNLKTKHPITWFFEEITEDLGELGIVDLPEGD